MNFIENSEKNPAERQQIENVDPIQILCHKDGTKIKLAWADAGPADWIEILLDDAKLSLTIATMLKDLGEVPNYSIPVHNISFDSLLKIVECLEKIATVKNETKIPQIFVKIIQKNIEKELEIYAANFDNKTLHAVFLAAVYLDIEPLQNICAKLWGQRCSEDGNEIAGNKELFLPIDLGRLAALHSKHHQHVVSWLLNPTPTILTGHKKAYSVNSVCFSPDSKILASGSHDKTIKLWVCLDGRWEEKFTLLGHTGFVSSVCFSPNGEMLASGSHDKTIIIWNVRDGSRIATLTGHTGEIFSVCISSDGKMLASGSDDKTTRIWNVEDGTCIARLTSATGRVHSVDFSPDCKNLASGSLGKTINIWNFEDGTWQKKATLANYSDCTQSVCFSPDGKLASGSSDKTIRIWDCAEGIWQEKATLSGHAGGVTSVCFSADAKALASGSNDKVTKFWIFKDGTWQEKASLDHSDMVKSVCTSPDGNMLAAGSFDHSIQIWNMNQIHIANNSLVKSFLEHPITIEQVMLLTYINQKKLGVANITQDYWFKIFKTLPEPIQEFIQQELGKK